MSFRLAIVLSHPTQYYSPWFRHLAARPGLELQVFYLWNFGVTESLDRSFGTSFTWDIPLLDGYDHEFIANRSRDPGTHHFRGLDNPGAVEALAAWKPDAVLLFGYAYKTHLRLILSRRLAGIPFLFRGDSHELFPATGWKSRASRTMRGLLFRRFARFLAVGQANAGYFRRSGVPEAKIHVVPHCVDNDRFQSSATQAATEAAQWKQELGIPAQATVVLFAGKFEEKKRPLDLLRAFHALRAESGDQKAEVRGRRSEIIGRGSEVGSQGSEVSTDFRAPTSDLHASPAVLLFVGSGPLENDLRAAAGDETGRTIFFAPFQNQTAMPKVYATCDLLVLPSFGRGETWGLAVNEAMNLARPAIVSSHVGCGPDLILEGETGWTFPAGDTLALQQVLTQALADPSRLHSMGQHAQAHIARYSYNTATEALIKVLGSLTSDR